MASAHSVVRLDQKLARAVEAGRGIRLEAPDLDMLAQLGLFEITNRAKNEYLKERAQCRDAKLQSTSAANTGSTTTSGKTEAAGAKTTTYSGMTPPRDVNAARQRVRAMKN